MTKTAKATICVSLLAMTVASGSAAAAGSRKLFQTGTVAGDATASVQLVVLKQDGKPKSVKGIKIKDILADCETGEELIKLKLSGPARISSEGFIKRRYGSKANGLARVEGEVSRRGQRVDADLSGTVIPIAGVGDCEVPTISFTTRY